MTELKPFSRYGRRALRGERLTDIPIIDHHGHLGIEPGGLSLDAEVAEVIAVMDDNGVSRTAVFGFGPDTRDVNDLILRGVAQHPDRFIGYATLLMDSPGDVMKELERCRGAGMVGLKLHVAFEKEPYVSKRFKPVWEFCAQHRWPVIIHGMDERLPRENPDTVFIAAHGIESVLNEASVRTVRECPNYYWCTSATVMAMGAIEKAVSLFGADRLIFGSDVPLNNQATRLGSVLAARISDDAMRKILGGNIARLLGLTLRDSFPM
ncbi:MAG: amidohydrolase [Lentisphaerae bacterium]|nr:amidohydrolase [Lentisphaerota bacterium]